MIKFLTSIKLPSALNLCKASMAIFKLLLSRRLLYCSSLSKYLFLFALM